MNAVIIDFDGTIADSFDNVLEFLAGQVGRKFSDISPDEKAQLKGLAMKDLAVAMGIPRWRLPFTYFAGKAMMSKRMSRTPVFAGMTELIRALHADHYQLYIVSSNNRRNINRFLSEHGLGGYFRKVYGNAGWFSKGPVLRKVMKQNNLESRQTVYVGDEVRDLVGAHLAGVAAVGVSWGFSTEDQLLRHNPTILARTPAELQKSLLDWGRTN